MQDNPIDPRWEDEGWNRMKELLDREMPPAAVQRKRPFAAITTVATLLAVACLSLFAYWIADRPFAQTEMPPIAAFAIPMLPYEADAQSAKPAQQAKAAGSSYTAVVPSPLTSPLALPAASESPASNNPTSRSNATIPPVSTTTAATLPSERSTTASSQLPESTVPTNQSLAVLPALPKQHIDVLSSAPPTLPGQPNQAKTACRLNYGLEASIGSADFSALQAWSAGVFAQWPLGKQSKWHARVSMGYQQILQTRTVNTHNFLLGNSRFPNTVGTVVLQSRTQLTQLDYLYVLPQLSYSFHPRWSIEAGIQYAYLLSQRNNTRWSVVTSTQEPTPSDSQEEELLGDLPESISDSKLPLRQHQLSLQLGMRYRINDRLSVSAQWQQGLSNIYQGEVRSDYNRLLLLGVGYEL